MEKFNKFFRGGNLIMSEEITPETASVKTADLPAPEEIKAVEDLYKDDKNSSFLKWRSLYPDKSLVPLDAVRGLLAVMLVSACIYIEIRGLEVSQFLSTSAAMILGFYYGGKSQWTPTPPDNSSGPKNGK
jgi:hypothetical protein